MIKLKNILGEIQNKTNLKTQDIDPKLRGWIEKKYGKMDPRDFFSSDMDTYFKTDIDHESEGGGLSHTIINLPSFSKLIKQLKKTREAAGNLIKGESVGDDEVLMGIYRDQRNSLNKLRTHIRNQYPAFYAQLKTQLTEKGI